MLATAGFRLLEVNERSQALEISKMEIQETLKSHFGSTFSGKVLTRVITGQQEAELAWIAARVGSLEANRSNRKRIGILEIGGASVQVVIPTEPDKVGRDNEDNQDLYIQSYLGYGAHEVESALNSRAIALQANRKDTIESPCGFEGNQELVETKTIKYTGDFDSCVHKITDLLQLDKRQMQKKGIDESMGDLINPIPKILLHDTQFYGLALFYHVSHFIHVSIRALPHFPKITLSTISESGRKLCSQPWNEMVKRYSDVDENTPPKRLPGRCFDAALLAALMTGLGIVDNDVYVEAVQKIGKINIDWTVGVAIHLLSGNNFYREDTIFG